MGKSKDLATLKVSGLSISGASGDILNVSSATGSEFAMRVDGNEISFKADADNDDNDSVMTFDLDGSEKMRLTDTGRLGIGITTPAQPLHVFKAGSQGGGMAPLIKLQNDTNNLTGDGCGIEFHGKYQGGEWGFGKIGGTNAGGNFGGALEFHTNTGTGSVSTGFTKKMTIDRNGYVTMPYQPAVSGKAPRPTPTGGYVTNSTNIYWGDLSLNNGNHWNNSTGVWTCPVAGKYWVYAGFLIDNDHTNATVARFHWLKNGSPFFIGYDQSYDTTSTYGGTVSSGGIFDCSANDTITLQATNGYLHAGGESHFTIYLLG